MRVSLLALVLWIVLWSADATYTKAVADKGDKVKHAGPDKELVERINKAIDSGVQWLVKRQKKDGSFGHEQVPMGGGQRPVDYSFGETALATLTLAHCGHGPKSPAVKKALSWLRKNHASAMTGDFALKASSYALSIYVLALHELYRGSVPKGQARIPAAAKKAMRKVVKWMLAKRESDGLFRYPGALPTPPGVPPVPGEPNAYGPQDLSATQYVILALLAATQCGVSVNARTVKSMARALLKWQGESGPSVRRMLDPPDPGPGGRYAPSDGGATDEARGFPYTPGGQPSGSMTAAGLSSVLAVKSMLVDLKQVDAEMRASLDRSIWDAIAWLSANYDISSNPRVGPQWHYYYLYGLERACVLAERRFLGTNEWYVHGARLLVDQQSRRGNWSTDAPVMGAPATARNLWDTCFALLFLTRASLKSNTPLLPQPVTTPRQK